MRIKSKQPGEVWIDRRSWQADSSTSADGRSVDDSSSIHICGFVSVCENTSPPSAALQSSVWSQANIQNVNIWKQWEDPLVYLEHLNGSCID